MTIPHGKIIDYPSPNYFEGIDTAIRAVCLHGTDGPLKAALATLCNPRRDAPGKAVSSNYLIAKNGDIYRLVPWWSGRRAYANGLIGTYDKSIKWLDQAIKKGDNPNWYTISIEHEASGDEMRSGAPMPEAQFNSSTWLVLTLLDQLKLEPDDQAVIGHRQINLEQKRYCPGVINIPAYIEVLKLRKNMLKV